jgi:DNA-binding response OmpR family regulator
MTTTKDTILIILTVTKAQELVQKMLAESGYDIIVAETDAAALETLQHVTPSLVVTDRRTIDYQKLRGHKMMRRVPIISFQDADSVCAQDECIDDLERGADVVVCNQSTRELVARVRAILRRQRSDRTPAVHCAAGGIHMDLDRHEVRVQGKPIELTPKEFQILRHFLEAPSRVFSRQEMLNRVWGEGYALEEHALDVHIHSLRQKIEENPAKPKLIVTVRGVGYKFRGEN